MKLKHYQVRGVQSPSDPVLLFRIRLDIHDIRSGYSVSKEGCYAAPWIDESDLDWTLDMVHSVDFNTLEEIKPPRPIEWPSNGDQKILRYFVHFSRTRIWRNTELALYSYLGQTKEDFLDKCSVFASRDMRGDLEKVKGIFLHRFLDLEQKRLFAVQAEPWDSETSEQRISQIRDAFSGIRESLSRCLMGEDVTPIREGDFAWEPTPDVESEERLRDVLAEFVARYNELVDECVAKAQSVEEYEVTVNHGQIEIISHAVLWK
ncbi:MAG TPA: hypothetical protein VMY18_03855 [Acidobacteriota bacterium]|nr:hypothetical protein [Acidobacteriota bacterium]